MKVGQSFRYQYNEYKLSTNIDLTNKLRIIFLDFFIGSVYEFASY